jgi:hypothetical protein
MEEQRRDSEHWLLYGATDAPIDRDDRLTEHVTCRSCGYDLISMHKGQQCPECGAPVAISVGGDLLSYSRPEWTAHVGQHVRIGGLLLMVFGVILVAGAVLAVFTGTTISGLLPSIVLVPWCYCVLQSTRLEPVRPGYSRPELVVRWSAGALALIILLSFGLAALKVPISGLGILALASVGFLTTLTMYLIWLSELLMRVPANDLSEAISRRAWVLLGLTGFIVLLVLAQGVLGIAFLAFFLAVPGWLFYMVRVGYGCVQAGETILCESRMAEQHWLEREALLDKERRFREPTHQPPGGGAGGIPTGS